MKQDPYEKVKEAWNISDSEVSEHELEWDMGGNPISGVYEWKKNTILYWSPTGIVIYLPDGTEEYY